jgi:hypothetical protein
LFIKIDPISFIEDKYFIISINGEKDKNYLKKKFGNYQSLIDCLFYKYPNMELRIKKDIIYVIK